MAYYEYRLTAGQPVQAGVQGKMILVDDIGAADGVDITPVLNSQEGRTMPARKKAFKCWVDYDAVILRADVDCVVRLFLTQTDVSLGFADGAMVNVVGGVTVDNDPSKRVPVDIGGGAVNVTADNVGINNTDANPVPIVQKAGTKLSTLPYLAAVIADPAPVAVGAAVGAVVAADPARRGLRLRNVGANPVALGGNAVAFGNAAVVLQPGDTWNENEAPGAAWYAICGAGLASTLNVQTIA